MVPTLEIMLAELESFRLEVVLAPLNPRMRGYNEGGCKRVCASRNCDWYRRHCAKFPSGRTKPRRNFDTRIKRRDTLRLLHRLIAGKTSTSIYAPELLAIARRRMRAA